VQHLPTAVRVRARARARVRVRVRVRRVRVLRLPVCGSEEMKSEVAVVRRRAGRRVRARARVGAVLPAAGVGARRLVLVALGRLQLGDLHGLRLAHRVAQQGHELRHLGVVEQPAVLDDR